MKIVVKMSTEEAKEIIANYFKKALGIHNIQVYINNFTSNEELYPEGDEDKSYFIKLA